MAVQTTSSAERARARFVLGREACAAGVDRTLFKAKPGDPRREQPERVAKVVRERAPHCSVGIATGGCPAPLHDALVALFDQVREKEGQ